VVQRRSGIPTRVERMPAVEAERVVPGWQFRPAKKERGIRKTKRGKGTKWMVIVHGREIPFGTTFVLRLRRKSGSRRRRSRRSAWAGGVARAVPGRSLG